MGFVLAVAVVAGGCVRHSSGEGDEPGTITSEERTADDGSFEPLLLPWEQQRFLIIAEETLISRCMGESGFVYEVIEPPLVMPARDARGRAFGSDDVGELKLEGYGLSAAATDSPVDANAVYVQALSESDQVRFGNALFGSDADAQTVEVGGGMALSISMGGCVAEARVSLFGDQVEWIRLFFSIENRSGEVTSRVLQDPLYMAALTKWQACMERRGFAVRDPGSARDLAARQYSHLDSVDAAVEERRIAAADGECVGESKLLEAAVGLEISYMAALLEERAGELVAYRELLDGAVDRATAVLGG
ncbi:MAG: hypothetical protein H8E59_07475 [Actinobacteria bacterium]|nr:hypothetical protein [Actinomycetota bacterium]